MTQAELDYAVAERTGEDVDEINRRGFTIADPCGVDFDPEPNDLPPQLVDWDEVDRERNVSLFARPSDIA